MKIQSLLLRALLLVLSAAFAVSTQAQMQNNGILPGPGWQVVQADWGAGSRRVDSITSTVFTTVCRLLSWRHLSSASGRV